MSEQKQSLRWTCYAKTAPKLTDSTSPYKFRFSFFYFGLRVVIFSRLWRSWHWHQVKPISLGEMPWYCVAMSNQMRHNKPIDRERWRREAGSQHDIFGMQLKCKSRARMKQIPCTQMQFQSKRISMKTGGDWERMRCHWQCLNIYWTYRASFQAAFLIIWIVEQIKYLIYTSCREEAIIWQWTIEPGEIKGSSHLHKVSEVNIRNVGNKLVTLFILVFLLKLGIRLKNSVQLNVPLIFIRSNWFAW